MERRRPGGARCVRVLSFCRGARVSVQNALGRPAAVAPTDDVFPGATARRVQPVHNTGAYIMTSNNRKINKVFVNNNNKQCARRRTIAVALHAARSKNIGAEDRWRWRAMNGEPRVGPGERVSLKGTCVTRTRTGARTRARGYTYLYVYTPCSPFPPRPVAVNLRAPRFPRVHARRSPRSV